MKFRITSDFGAVEQFRDHAHTGKDFAIPDGTPLYSFTQGIVDKVVDYGDKLTGKTVVVNVGDGKQLVFGHLKDIAVKQGERLNVGELIGHSGNSGFSTGSHLHFAVKQNGSWVDPSAYDTAIQHINNKIGWFDKWFNKGYEPISLPDANWGDALVQKMMDAIGHGLHNFFQNLYDATYMHLPEIAGCLTILFGIMVMATGNFAKWGSRYLTFLFGVIIWKIAG